MVLKQVRENGTEYGSNEHILNGLNSNSTIERKIQIKNKLIVLQLERINMVFIAP